MFNGFEYGGRVLRVHFDKYTSTPVSAANLGLLNLGARSSPLNLPQPQLTGQSSFGSRQSPFSHAAASQFSQQQQQQQQMPSMPSMQGASIEAVRDALAAQQQQHYYQQQQQQQQSGNGLFGGDAPAYTFLEELEYNERPSELSLGSLATLVPRSRRGSSSTSARSGSFGAGSSLTSFEGSALRNSTTSTNLNLSGPSLSAPPASQLDSDPNSSSLKATPPPESSSSLPSTVSATSPGLAQRRISNSGNGNGSRSAAQASLSLLTNSQSQSHSPRGSGTHPAHPGPISLPPPSVVSGFPIPMQHTLSPLLASPLHNPYAPQQTTPGAYPHSPYAHHPQYATPGQPPIAYSPLHHPAHGVLMTPHGIPPITPSMPSFSFAAQPTPVASMGGMSIASPPPHAHAGAYLPHHPHHARYSSHGAQIPQHPGLVHTASFSPGLMMSPGQGPFFGGPPAPIGKASGSGLRHGGETGGEGEEGENQSVNEQMQQGMGSPFGQHAPQYMQHPMGSPGYFVQMEPSGYFPPMPPPSDGDYFPPVAQSDMVAHEILRDPSSSSDERRRRMSASSVLSEAETDFGMEGGDARSSAATSRTGDETSTPESVVGEEGAEEGKEKEKKDARSYSMSSGEGVSRDRRPAIQKNHSDEAAPGHAQTTAAPTTQKTRSRSVADKEGPSVSRPPVVGSHSDETL